MKQAVCLVSVLAVAGILALVGLTGCDKEENAVVIAIVPNAVEVTVSNSTVTLTATGGMRALSLPLSWSVSNPVVGNIDPAYRGIIATYVSTDSNGVNLVTVRDQYGAEGHATITHTYPIQTNGATTITVTPNPVEITERNSAVMLTATGGPGALTLPLTWYVSNGDLGRIDPAYRGYIAVYVSADQEGVNLITVRDQFGTEGHATVTQTYSSDGGGGGGLTVLDVVASPGQIPVGSNSSSINVITDSPSPPYSWRVGDETYGVLVPSTGTNTVYRSLRRGINTVYVTDADGRVGQINIEAL